MKTRIRMFAGIAFGVAVVTMAADATLYLMRKSKLEAEQMPLRSG